MPIPEKYIMGLHMNFLPQNVHTMCMYRVQYCIYFHLFTGEKSSTCTNENLGNPRVFQDSCSYICS